MDGVDEGHLIKARARACMVRLEVPHLYDNSSEEFKRIVIKKCRIFLRLPVS